MIFIYNNEAQYSNYQIAYQELHQKYITLASSLQQAVDVAT
jgi:hypothetical protein